MVKNNAFAANAILRYVDGPNVESIEYNAFAVCLCLSNICFPKLKFIDSSVFYINKELKEFVSY